MPALISQQQRPALKVLGAVEAYFSQENHERRLAVSRREMRFPPDRSATGIARTASKPESQESRDLVQRRIEFLDAEEQGDLTDGGGN